MAVTKRKKKSIPKRPKVGLKGAPLDQGFEYLIRYFYDEIDQKTVSSICKQYVKDNFDKADARAIFANPEYHFYGYNGRAAAIYWLRAEMEFPEKYSTYPEYLRKTYSDLIETGQKILDDAKKEKESGSKKRVLTPQELFRAKVDATVGTELDMLEDEWIMGEKTDRDLYNLFQINELKSAATAHLKPRLEIMRSEYADAYDKTCDQAVEAFSHLTRTELKRRLSIIDRMLTDLDKIKAAAKATRKPRAPKTKTADKQIKTLKFLKEDNEYKLVSISPLQVPGARRLYTFNVKTRELTELATTAANGFEIKGTTIQNFDPTISRKVRLRKPDEMLPIVMSKTVKQIDKAWSGLTTKTAETNGRINKDMILLRVEDK